MEFKFSDAVALCGVATEIRQQQVLLNDMYEPNWRTQYEVDKLALSACSEFNEMLEEIKGVWKFYGSSYQNDWAGALEEYIDVVHFMATIELCNGADPVYDDASDVVMRSWDSTSFNSRKSRLLVLIKNNMKRGGFLQLLSHGCRLFRLTPEQLLVAYLHKNKKNQARAKAGALTRDIKDIKELEQSTFDYMFENGFISLSREEYNSMVDEND